MGGEGEDGTRPGQRPARWAEGVGTALGTSWSTGVSSRQGPPGTQGQPLVQTPPSLTQSTCSRCSSYEQGDG